MTDYIRREDAIELICSGCNEEFSEEPCEPSECRLLDRLKNIPAADVVSRETFEAVATNASVMADKIIKIRQLVGARNE